MTDQIRPEPSTGCHPKRLPGHTLFKTALPREPARHAVILIVDDDPDFQLLTRKVLAAGPYHLLSAETGAQALEMVRCEQPDLMLLDVSLPDISGLEVCQRVKTDPESSQPHILFVSGMMQTPEDQARALRTGGDGILAKPVNHLHLLAHIEAALRIKRTEDALRFEREQFLSIFQGLGEFAYVVDPKTHEILFANQAMHTAFGTSLEGRPCYQVLQGLDAPCDFCTNAGLLRNPTESHVWEHSNLMLGLHLLVTDRLIQWPDGRKVIFKFGVDITRRKQAETELRQREIFLRTLIGTIPVPIFYKDKAGRYLGCNPAFEQFFGTSAEELTGKSVFDINPPDLARIYHARDAELLEHPGEQVYEAQVRNARGETRDVVFHKASLADDEGHVTGLIGVVLDMTQNKQAAAALRRSEERFQLAMNATRDGLWDWNLENDAVYFSPGYTAMLGYAPDEILPSLQFWKDSIHPEDIAPALEKITECIENQSDFFTIQFRMRTKAGHWLWIQGRGQAVSRDAAGRATRLVGTHVDITERKQDEARLEQAMRRAEAANTAKSEFLANMSHEIRTPMNGVIGMTRLLLDSGLTSEQQTQGRIILNSAEALLGLLNDILDFSKIEAGKLELAPTDFAPRVLVDELRSITAHRVETRGLAFSATVDPSVPERLWADASRLRQILTNLLENAVKFTEAGKISLHVHASQANTQATPFPERLDNVSGDNAYANMPGPDTGTIVNLCFTVRDTGIGIAQDKQDLLFEKFRQVDASSTRKFGGSGLGLAICKQLVELMGGSIGMHSQPGQGSTFWFTVPLKVPVAVPAAMPAAMPAAISEGQTSQSPHHQSSPISPCTGMPQFHARVLLVEDNQVNQIVARGILKKLGIQADVADNGEQALGMLADQPYDLVLMDVQMPVMDGLTAAREIRRLENQNAGMLECWNAGIEKAARNSKISDTTDLPEKDPVSGSPAPRHPGIPAFQNSRIPIIAMTAGAMQVDKDRCLEAGMDAHVAKPVNPTELVRVLSQWLTPMHNTAA